MSEQKRYTADELREAAGWVVSELYTNPFSAMLRQAADSEEELHTMRSTWFTPETSKALFDDCVSKTKEIYELKARLEAVVKECEKFDHLLDNLTQTANDLGCELSAKSAKSDKIIITAILRAARGEGNVE